MYYSKPTTSVSRWSRESPKCFQAEKCVSVEFVLLEQKSSHLSDLPETINKFDKQISELENCSFRAFFTDGNVFHILVKQCMQDLKDDMEEQLQSQFIFKRDLVGSLKQIYCSLCSSCSPMLDGFTPCQDYSLFCGFVLSLVSQGLFSQLWTHQRKAVENQLSVLSRDPSPYSVQELRKMGAAHMRKRTPVFLLPEIFSYSEIFDERHAISDENDQEEVAPQLHKYTIEEKVIERAYKKLALDALVIQQGRLAEQRLLTKMNYCKWFAKINRLPTTAEKLTNDNSRLLEVMKNPQAEHVADVGLGNNNEKKASTLGTANLLFNVKSAGFGARNEREDEVYEKTTKFVTKFTNW
ncbi:hypothetical protein ACET3Z_009710 [Daucus carota]